MEWAGLRRLFGVHYTIPRSNLLEAFLQTWESTKHGQIWAIVNGEKITIDQTLIAKQFGVGTKGVVDATNALVKEA